MFSRSLVTTGAVAALGLFFVIPESRAQWASTMPEPTCLTGGKGDRACGYNCLSAYGVVRCAQTPSGVCHHGSDIIACWDPPALVRSVAAGRPVPRPSCVTAAGKTACGYHCVTGSDQVQCAETPWGACAAGQGTVACWDPPAAVLASFRGAASIPQGTCSTTYGQVTCGYKCVAIGGKVACSQSPEGICRSEGEQATCFDPPPESRGAVYDPAGARSCMENGANARTCGHHCLATHDRLACAPTERGVCLESRGEITCKG